MIDPRVILDIIVDSKMAIDVDSDYKSKYGDRRYCLPLMGEGSDPNPDEIFPSNQMNQKNKEIVSFARDLLKNLSVTAQAIKQYKQGMNEDEKVMNVDEKEMEAFSKLSDKINSFKEYGSKISGEKANTIVTLTEQLKQQFDDLKNAYDIQDGAKINEVYNNFISILNSEDNIRILKKRRITIRSCLNVIGRFARSIIGCSLASGFFFRKEPTSLEKKNAIEHVLKLIKPTLGVTFHSI